MNEDDSLVYVKRAWRLGDLLQHLDAVQLLEGFGDLVWTRRVTDSCEGQSELPRAHVGRDLDGTELGT
ncbi:hypothetical protein SEA_ALSABER_2 [Streptomyces phage Alsaber]|uniref:Uncharacterized protein n=1 Tax=Streptomyces phage Alsaber TaxID=2053672 RepID=A0A2H4PGE1_9CAUD|nr:hypothetical protein KGG97_gp02 [Streptomyces phage Alsaber]ATW61277.1 hypothetical protein SEA_ALSABER_2 [Streptomyces phage Alsaber]